ncbi:TPA: metallophosphoesterase [Vibrio parahaemolyticus]|nr:metallophosphoesterase [Vibrio parahaemolyticus]UJX30392.1 metallophosphoesterase [Vibrio parahaemolyticus]HCG9193019.1 metallophosphoesterase [Vibrio parahaemolyticus]HCG9194577.1 metallophosphoesterase [Vibrio parahaemolyticus]HCH0833160.1 metallophosphoesterase [Vibrio parahaemolyticus]
MRLTTQGSLKIAVVSDLHFVNSDRITDSRYHSWLIFEPDGTMKNGFWSSLLEKIEKDKITADILICPGDITTHAEGSALKFAWSKLNELAEALGCSQLATATGNHDVNSRGIAVENPIRDLDKDQSLVENLKQLTPAYPLVDLQTPSDKVSHVNRVQYFGADFLHSSKNELFNLVILNSCSSHTNDPTSYERGYVSASTHQWLESSLKEKYIPSNKKLGILVCHHHPILHSDHNIGTYDFMKGGNELLQMLNKYGNWIVIHGHKHHARLSYYADGSKNTVVFSAGTLSHHKDHLGDDFTNQFYVLDIDITKTKGIPKGTLDVYSWQANHWALSRRQKDGVFTGVGFGEVGCLEELAEEISKKVHPVTGLEWNDLLEAFPQLKYRLPKDLEHLEANLQAYNIDITTNADGEFAKLEKSEV